MTTTIERERHRAAMRAAAVDLALDAIIEWVGPFAYRDIVDAVRRGLFELGYEEREVISSSTWGWARQVVLDLVADGSVTQVRAYPSLPNLYAVNDARQ